MDDRIESPVIEQQLLHRSVRKYLDTPVTDAQVEAIIGAAQRASTSSNLQAWSVVVVRDRDRMRRISESLGGRDYVENAPVLLVWVADLARNAGVVQQHVDYPEAVDYIESTIIACVDVALAAQNALLAAESLGLGGVFVGSIRDNPEAVSAELGLPQHAFPVVAMPIGVPDPAEGTGIKPRLPLSAVMHPEQYDSERSAAGAAEFETRDREYYAGQGVDDRSWQRIITRRFGTVAGLGTRVTMRESLAKQGFASK